MKIGSITIDRRFRGPPTSANGGYASGRLASFISGSAEVTLRSPPPLEKEMAVVSNADGSVAMYDGEQLVATARPQAASVQACVPPHFDAAIAASQRTFDASRHKLPMCYVCGPDRAPGDGLRLFCGPLDPQDTSWSGIVAAPFVPEPYMGSGDGPVSPEFVWAALDCPTAYAASSSDGFPTILLGRQTVSIKRQPNVGEKCIVTAKQIAREGRKYFSQATLFGSDQTAIAQCQAVWIEVDREVQLGGIRANQNE